MYDNISVPGAVFLWNEYFLLSILFIYLADNMFVLLHEWDVE